MDCANSSNVPACNATSNCHEETSLRKCFSATYYTRFDASISSSTIKVYDTQVAYRSWAILHHHWSANRSHRRAANTRTASRDQASALTGSGSLLPSEIITAPSMLRAAPSPPVPPPRSSPRVQAQFVRTGYPASRNSSPPSTLSQLASTGEPQSHFSAPFTSTGPASTLPQLVFGKEAFDVTTSEASRQSQYQIFTFETEQGPIQVPLDVQGGSKAADEKRKRNATASHRFRQRRKEKEQEISIKISGLEAQLQGMMEEKEHYQRERDFLQDMILRYRIPIPPRPLSPRRRRHASLGGPQAPDTERSAQTGDRITLRSTSACIPQGQPPHTVAAHVPI